MFYQLLSFLIILPCPICLQHLINILKYMFPGSFRLEPVLWASIFSCLAQQSLITIVNISRKIPIRFYVLPY